MTTTGTLRVTILGCGSSGGVPRIGGDWGACDPSNPKNRRRRCSILVERIGPNGKTRVLIDSSPDLREQLLDARVSRLDAVAYTHDHADHTHGLDDLRAVVFNTRKRLPLWADAPTGAVLRQRFGYAFETPEGSDYPPICDLHQINGSFTITGPGGEISLTPFPLVHGRQMALGFRIDDVAYSPDVNAIPEESWGHLYGLRLWIVDALRYKPHPTHAHLAQALAWIERAQPQQAVLTNLHVDLDYERLRAEIPPHVQPAFDGLRFTF